MLALYTHTDILEHVHICMRICVHICIPFTGAPLRSGPRGWRRRRSAWTTRAELSANGWGKVGAQEIGNRGLGEG